MHFGAFFSGTWSPINKDPERKKSIPGNKRPCWNFSSVLRPVCFLEKYTARMSLENETSVSLSDDIPAMNDEGALLFSLHDEMWFNQRFTFNTQPESSVRSQATVGPDDPTQLGSFAGGLTQFGTEFGMEVGPDDPTQLGDADLQVNEVETNGTDTDKNDNKQTNHDQEEDDDTPVWTSKINETNVASDEVSEEGIDADVDIDDGELTSKNALNNVELENNIKEHTFRANAIVENTPTLPIVGEEVRFSLRYIDRDGGPVAGMRFAATCIGPNQRLVVVVICFLFNICFLVFVT